MSEPGQTSAASAAARRAAVGLVRVYQRALSPWLPAACRFYPTCSEYAAEAVMRFGVARGLWMAACRLGRCHPFHRGGYDPVPERRAVHPPIPSRP